MTAFLAGDIWGLFMSVYASWWHVNDFIISSCPFRPAPLTLYILLSTIYIYRLGHFIQAETEIIFLLLLTSRQTSKRANWHDRATTDL